MYEARCKQTNVRTLKPSSNITQLDPIMRCHCIMLMYETSRKQMKVPSKATQLEQFVEAYNMNLSMMRIGKQVAV